MELNYKTVYSFLLSLFGIIMLLYLTGHINSSLAGNYSIIGIIACVIAWIIDEQIIHKAGEIRNSGIYVPSVDDPHIHEILGKRITLLWILLGVLLIVLFVSLI